MLAEPIDQAEHAASLVTATYTLEDETTSFAAAKAQATKQGIYTGQ